MPPQTPRRGSGSRVGIPWGGDAVRRPFGSACPPMVPSRNQPSSPTWARKGSMSRCAHRPLSQSVFWLDRRVNSAAGERVGLDPRERGTRRPVVTACYIDPTTAPHQLFASASSRAAAPSGSFTHGVRRYSRTFGRLVRPSILSCFLEVAGGWCGGGSAPYPRALRSMKPSAAVPRVQSAGALTRGQELVSCFLVSGSAADCAA